VPQYSVHKAADHRRQTKASGQSLSPSPTPAGPRFSPAVAPDQRGGHSSLSSVAAIDEAEFAASAAMATRSRVRTAGGQGPYSGVTYAPDRPPSTMKVEAVT
jgi:hypothetical protein